MLLEQAPHKKTEGKTSDRGGAKQKHRTHNQCCCCCTDHSGGENGPAQCRRDLAACKDELIGCRWQLDTCKREKEDLHRRLQNCLSNQPGNGHGNHTAHKECLKKVRELEDKNDALQQRIDYLTEELKWCENELDQCHGGHGGAFIPRCRHLDNLPPRATAQQRRNAQAICEWSDYQLAKGFHARGERNMAIRIATRLKKSVATNGAPINASGGPTITSVNAFFNWVTVIGHYHGNWRQTFVQPAAQDRDVYWPSYNAVMSIEIVHRQQALAAMGFYGPQKPDNKSGPKTKEAIRAFQSAVGLIPDGTLLEEQLVRLIAVAAEAYNDANSQVVLGTMYLIGLGVEKDGDLAKKWYEAAFNRTNPHPDAAYNLGLYHEQLSKNADRSITKLIDDLEESLTYYKAAKTAGHPGATQAINRVQRRLTQAKKLNP